VHYVQIILNNCLGEYSANSPNCARMRAVTPDWMNQASSLRPQSWQGSCRVPGLFHFRKSPAKQTCRPTCSDLRSDQNHRSDSGRALTSRCSGRTNHEPSAPTTNGRSEDRPATHCVLFPAPPPSVGREQDAAHQLSRSPSSRRDARPSRASRRGGCSGLPDALKLLELKYALTSVTRRACQVWPLAVAYRFSDHHPRKQNT
jgi:hypothetical protein